MTWILGPGPSYEKRRMPNVGYLKSSSGRSDSDCVRRDHLSRVLDARRQREGRVESDARRLTASLEPWPTVVLAVVACIVCAAWIVTR